MNALLMRRPPLALLGMAVASAAVAPGASLVDAWGHLDAAAVGPLLEAGQRSP